MFLPSPASTRPVQCLKPASQAFVRYISTAQQAGCPPDQIKRFVRLGIVLQLRQLEASAAARRCDEEDGPSEIGYGGARGGGKSHWAVAQLTDDCLRFAGLKCLLLRKVGKANKENFGDLIRRILKKQRVSYTYTQHDGTLRFANGSAIILGHFQAEKDIDAYLGLEYDVIAVEEATTLSASKYRSIQTCNRTSKPGWRPRMYSTTNPGGIGHGWYKARFLDPHRKKTETSTYFVSATIDDNAFVNKDYEKVLNSLCGWQLRAWRYGDWDIAAGQYFTNFRADIDGKPWHVLPSAGFNIPANWQVWASFDYGFTHYTSVHLFAKDTDGNLYVVDEHCERGWVPERHAAAIKAMLARHALPVTRLWRFVAGVDVFSKNRDGGTTADIYQGLGIRLEAANNDRIAGATRILSLFGDADATVKDSEDALVPAPIAPRVFILDRCTRLVECLPALQHDPHRPEDVLKVDCDEDGLGGDDCFVAGTLITTIDGQRPIEEIRAGELVLTRQGYRPVLASWQSRRASNVLTATLSDGRTITGTPNHPFWVENEGWRCMDAVRYGTMLPCLTANPHLNPRSLSLTVSRSEDIRNRDIRTTGNISHLMHRTSSEVYETFTSRYGNPFTEKFLKDIISTILTEIHSTTPLKTSNGFPLKSILSAIALKVAFEAPSLSNSQARWLSVLLGLPIGIALKQAGRGIVSMGSMSSLCDNPLPLIASNAGQHLKAQRRDRLASALSNANLSGDGTQGWTESIRYVKNAESRFPQISMISPGSAPVYVLAITDSGKTDTFALHVQGCHEYYANGILVKNCYDDFRYGVMVDAQNPEKPLYTPGMAAGRQMLGRGY